MKWNLWLYESSESNDSGINSHKNKWQSLEKYYFADKGKRDLKDKWAPIQSFTYIRIYLIFDEIMEENIDFWAKNDK